jgi:hypothetical protein
MGLFPLLTLRPARLDPQPTAAGLTHVLLEALEHGLRAALAAGRDPDRFPRSAPGVLFLLLLLAERADGFRNGLESLARNGPTADI